MIRGLILSISLVVLGLRLSAQENLLKLLNDSVDASSRS